MRRALSFFVLLLGGAMLLPLLIGLPQEPEDIIQVHDHMTDKSLKLPLEEFVVGVVAAEMPALFETESLKAQAVAARTYIVSRLQKGELLCTDPSHCQAYADEQTLKSRWGEHYDAYYQRILKAVKETEGVIAVYEGEPIAAVFHAASSGRTEDGVAVWGTDTPYLKSVESAIPAQLNEMETEAVFERNELLIALRTLHPQVQDTTPLVQEVTKTAAGRVDTITLGNIPFSGLELRGLLSLNSTDFTITEDATQVYITTRGKGHGVGMSQYGCNELAKAGKTYQEILAHYYPGTGLHKLENI